MSFNDKPKYWRLVDILYLAGFITLFIIFRLRAHSLIDNLPFPPFSWLRGGSDELSVDNENIVAMLLTLTVSYVAYGFYVVISGGIRALRRKVNHR